MTNIQGCVSLQAQVKEKFLLEGEQPQMNECTHTWEADVYVKHEYESTLNRKLNVEKHK